MDISNVRHCTGISSAHKRLFTYVFSEFFNQSNHSNSDLCWTTSHLSRADVYRIFVVSISSFYLTLPYWSGILL